MQLPSFVRTWLLVLLAVLFAPAVARAQQPPAHADEPHDAVAVDEPSTVALPPLPNDFARQSLGWMRASYPASVRDRVEPIVAAMDAFKPELAEALGQDVLSSVELRIARDPDEMAKLAPPNVPPPTYATGVAYPALHLVLITLKSPYTYEAPDVDEVLRHELTHVALFDATLGHHVPMWFNDGLAIHESGEAPWKRTKELWQASTSGALLPLSELDASFPEGRYEVTLAYAESADFVRFLLREGDRARFQSLIERVRGGTPFERALGDAYGVDLRRLEYQWHEEMSKRYGLLPALTGGSLLWVGVAALMGIGWWRKKKRTKAKLAEWEREERELEAALASARSREERASEPSPATPPVVVPRPSGAPPMIEHDGRWYTLH